MNNKEAESMMRRLVFSLYRNCILKNICAPRECTLSRKVNVADAQRGMVKKQKNIRIAESQE